MIGKPEGPVQHAAICVGASLPQEGLAGTEVIVFPTIEAALATPPHGIETVAVDLRGPEVSFAGFRRLRSAFPRAFLLGIVDARTTLSAKWEATKAGCDEFLLLPHLASDENAASRLRLVFSGAQPRRYRVLVVDDNENNRDLVKQELEDAGFDVTPASNGMTALSLAGRADLVLLDIMMPGMDGREVCRRLRAGVATSHLPVVMLSALDQIKDKLEALDMGASDYVTKPYDPEQLVAKLRRLLWLRDTQAVLERHVVNRP
ncbi:MAG: response regulator [Deltaproteobacteria bacterium]|nr:response regulator [Deltaproteobacteria bacterium]